MPRTTAIGITIGAAKGTAAVALATAVTAGPIAVLRGKISTHFQIS